jgi:hypothetical protein
MYAERWHMFIAFFALMVIAVGGHHVSYFFWHHSRSLENRNSGSHQELFRMMTIVETMRNANVSPEKILKVLNNKPDDITKNK